MDPVSSYSRPDVPPPLRLAAAIVVLQGLVSIGFGLAEALSTTGARAVMGATTSLFFVAFGAGMVFCAWGLIRLSTWARGPILLAQLISLGLAWSFRDAATGLVSLGFAVPAVLALIGMLHPRTIEALERTTHPDQD